MKHISFTITTIILIYLSSWATSLADDLSYYQVSIEVGDVSEPTRGYANINWADPTNVVGQICVEGSAKQIIRGENREPGTAQLQIVGLKHRGVAETPIEFKRRNDDISIEYFGYTTWWEADGI